MSQSPVADSEWTCPHCGLVIYWGLSGAPNAGTFALVIDFHLQEHGYTTQAAGVH